MLIRKHAAYLFWTKTKKKSRSKLDCPAGRRLRDMCELSHFRFRNFFGIPTSQGDSAYRRCFCIHVQYKTLSSSPSSKRWWTIVMKASGSNPYRPAAFRETGSFHHVIRVRTGVRSWSKLPVHRNALERVLFQTECNPVFQSMPQTVVIVRIRCHRKISVPSKPAS